MAIDEVESKRWTTAQYDRIAASGFLDDGRSELIEGKIFMMSAQTPRHAAALDTISDTLKRAFGAGYSVRIKSPLNLGEFSAPQPDIVVVLRAAREHVVSHPTTALLIVEVSDASLSHYREEKQSAYSSAVIPEYWIVNLVSSTLEVFCQPSKEGYLDAQILKAGDMVAPLALSGVEIPVSSFLP